MNLEDKKENRIIFYLIVLIILVNLPFLLMGTYDKSYDANTHIFFASHWLKTWWNDFDPRWYTGFSVFSYPPFAHQLVALLGFFTGLKTSFIIIQTLVLVFILIGVYRYCRIWFSKTSSLISSILIIFSSSLAIIVHVFGQYPNTVSLALILNMAPYIYRWILKGGKINMVISLLLFTPTIFTSLFSNFFGMAFFMLPIFFDLLVINIKNIHLDNQMGFTAEKRGSFLRFSILVVFAIVILIICLSPFFYWLKTNPFEQTPIPHASRDNIIEFTKNGYYLFYGLYGIFLVLLPIFFAFILKSRRLLIFLPSILVLFLFSTGGSISLNKVILGNFFNILTFDRFAFWNTVILIPIAGNLIEKIFLNKKLFYLKISGFILFIFIYITIFFINSFSPFYNTFPSNLDFKAVINFLEKDEVKRFRFITLGFGGNNLSSLTTVIENSTIDGNYNFARRIPELNQSTIALIDEAKYYGYSGVDALSKFLIFPQKYNLKYVLLKDKFYTPLLITSGWKKEIQLTPFIEVWEPIGIIKEEKLNNHQKTPFYFNIIWGVFPLLTFFAGILLIIYYRKIINSTLRELN